MCRTEQWLQWAYGPIVLASILVLVIGIVMVKVAKLLLMSHVSTLAALHRFTMATRFVAVTGFTTVAAVAVFRVQGGRSSGWCSCVLSLLLLWMSGGWPELLGWGSDVLLDHFGKRWLGFLRLFVRVFISCLLVCFFSIDVLQLKVHALNKFGTAWHIQVHFIAVQVSIVCGSIC